jgi:hypothetical protein
MDQLDAILFDLILNYFNNNKTAGARSLAS